MPEGIQRLHGLSEEKPVLGKDLLLNYAEVGADLKVSSSGDLQLVDDEFNLGQAIVHRLRTRPGELLDIGHSTYGSTLYDLIGEPNTEGTREKVKAVVIAALKREPRVEKIVRVVVTPLPSRLDAVDVDISVIATGSEVPLNVVMPFYLENV
jgi:phage baseplate assembly protein W